MEKICQHLAELGELVSEALYDILQEQSKAAMNLSEKIDYIQEQNQAIREQNEAMKARLYCIEKYLLEKKAKKGFKSLFQ